MPTANKLWRACVEVNIAGHIRLLELGHAFSPKDRQGIARDGMMVAPALHRPPLSHPYRSLTACDLGVVLHKLTHLTACKDCSPALGNAFCHVPNVSRSADRSPLASRRVEDSVSGRETGQTSSTILYFRR